RQSWIVSDYKQVDMKIGDVSRDIIGVRLFHHWEYFLLEILTEQSFPLICQVAGFLYQYVFFGQGRRKLLPTFLLLAEKWKNLASGHPYLLQRSHPRAGSRLKVTSFNVLLKDGGVGHEEFIEITSTDSEEFHTFKKRLTSILCFFEDSVVEPYPSNFLIDKKRGIIQRFTLSTLIGDLSRTDLIQFLGHVSVLS